MLINLLIIFVASTALFYGISVLFSKAKVVQTIFELSPDRHQSKGATPTAGGLGMLVIWGSTLALLPKISMQEIWLFACFASFALLGMIDDVISMVLGRNKGLSAKQKLGLQIVAATGLLFSYHWLISPLGLATGLFYGFSMVGAANATNLTDGLDGLLGGLAIISILAFYTVIDQVFLGHWQLYIVAGLLGYLVVNWHPAKLFMGDTGSLAIGAYLAGLAITLNNIWLLLPFGAVYIVETLSVIVQVVSYKWRGRRVFLMAPLHHHFELLGMAEVWVVGLFWSIGGGFAILGSIL